MIAGQTLRKFLDDVAARTPSPGGGATAAVSGAIGAAQLLMVAEYASWSAADDPRDALREVVEALLHLADEDAAAYAAYRAAPKGDAAARTRIRAVPKETIRAATRALELGDRIKDTSKAWFAVDISIAMSCLKTCLEGAQSLYASNQ